MLGELNEITIDIANQNAVAVLKDSNGDYMCIYHESDEYSPLRTFRVPRDCNLAREIRRHLRADIFWRMPDLTNRDHAKDWDIITARYNQLVAELTEAGCLTGSKWDMYVNPQFSV